MLQPFPQAEKESKTSLIHIHSTRDNGARLCGFDVCANVYVRGVCASVCGTFLDVCALMSVRVCAVLFVH